MPTCDVDTNQSPSYNYSFDSFTHLRQQQLCECNFEDGANDDTPNVTATKIDDDITLENRDVIKHDAMGNNGFVKREANGINEDILPSDEIQSSGHHSWISQC